MVGFKWTTEERTVIRALSKESLSIRPISERMGRSRTAVYIMYCVGELVGWYDAGEPKAKTFRSKSTTYHLCWLGWPIIGRQYPKQARNGCNNYLFQHQSVLLSTGISLRTCWLGRKNHLPFPLRFGTPALAARHITNIIFQ